MASPSDADPPSYVSRPPDFTEHRYQLEDSKGRPWLWLTVKSRSREARQLPLFFDRDTITGSVEVDLDKAEGSKGVLISVGPPTNCRPRSIAHAGVRRTDASRAPLSISVL